MDKQPLTICPNGEDGCPIFTEISKLRATIEKLSTLVQTDQLTGLFNKRYLFSQLETEIERASRTQHPLSLIMLDVDHFKEVNDIHGHMVGDEVLIHIAQVIGTSIRKIDLACRFGGEEFAVILPSTPLLVAVKVAERVREYIESVKVDVKHHTLNLTASLGVSVFNPNQPISIEQLLNRADKQLYAAKQNGRNRVEFDLFKPKAGLGISHFEKKELFKKD